MCGGGVLGLSKRLNGSSWFLVWGLSQRTAALHWMAVQMQLARAALLFTTTWLCLHKLNRNSASAGLRQCIAFRPRQIDMSEITASFRLHDILVGIQVVFWGYKHCSWHGLVGHWLYSTQMEISLEAYILLYWLANWHSCCCLLSATCALHFLFFRGIAGGVEVWTPKLCQFHPSYYSLNFANCLDFYNVRCNQLL